MWACGSVWGENAGHPSLTHITGYLTIPGGKEGEGGKRERKSCIFQIVQDV